MTNLCFLQFILLVVAAFPVGAADSGPVYRNPVDCAVDAGGQRAFVALAGPRAVAVVDLQRKTMSAQWPLPLPPSGLAVAPGGETVAVTMGDAQGRVAMLNPVDGSITRQFDAGFSPVSPVFLEQGRRIAICNRFIHSVGFYATATGELIGIVPVTREPVAAVATRDGKFLFVACLLPAQPATAPHVASTIDVIDVFARKRNKSILLPNGSASVHAVALSPDGKYLFVTHILAHYQLPANQLERGWMNANALSVIDTGSAALLGTVLLDDTTLGAANPWGVAVTADGKYLAVAHAGTHELSRIPLEPLLQIVTKQQSAPTEKKPPGQLPRQVTSYDDQAGLERDLTTMTRIGRARIPMPGGGPRAVVATGSRVLVCEYFSGQLMIVDFAKANAEAIKSEIIALGPEPDMDIVRRGELCFADARLCFQRWQSCLSCHPDARADGLNWDLLNDGLGNPKQVKSLLYAHVTPPAMAHGERGTAEEAVRAGIQYILFAKVDESQARAIDAYLRSIRPVPSPRLIDGKLSARAIRGKAVYERVGCAECHNGPYFTDRKLHEMPYASGPEVGIAFDTPELVEVWRTAPYLYDGRAATMAEALRIKLKGVADLSQEEMDDLVEYVLSL